MSIFNGRGGAFGMRGRRCPQKPWTTARLAWFAALALVAAVVTSGAEAKPDPAAVTKGQIIYARYCVSCHGTAGRGDGSLSHELRKSAPDLTTLTSRSGGNYPYDRVTRIITSGETLRSHGTSDMPAWGDVFKRTKGTETEGPNSIETAVRDLAHYIWSLQRPAKDEASPSPTAPSPRPSL